MILRYSKCCEVGRRHWNLDAHCNLSRTLNTMAKYGIVDYNHFVGMMSKFIPHGSFIKEPVKVESITIEELDRVFSKIK